MEKRILENPLIKDKVTVIATSKETKGAFTLLEVELAAGGGNSLHAHTSFTEEFTALEGTLGIGLEKNNLRLEPGQSVTAPIGKWHRFYNPGNTTIRFRVKLLPGHENFENGLRIAYGLASDGKTNKKGIPKSFSHLAVIVSLTDTILPGFLSLIQPVLKRKAMQAAKNGIRQELLERYC